MSENNRENAVSVKSARRPGGGWKAILLLLAAVIYGIIPVDAIPDFIPIFGLGDDVLAILGAIFYFYKAFFKIKSPTGGQPKT